MTKIKWSMKAFRELRTMPETVGMLQGAAEVVRDRAANAGDTPRNYELYVKKGRRRTSIQVGTGDPVAIKSNLKHNSLLKALGEL